MSKNAIIEDVDNPIDNSNQRCYNYNLFGHFADECRYPKRERSPCYAYGIKCHKAANCPIRFLRKILMTILY